MIPITVRCWRIVRAIKTAAHQHHLRHIGHHAHRVGRAVIQHKITWTCITIVAGGAGVSGIPMLWPIERPAAAPMPPGASAGIDLPAEFFQLPPGLTGALLSPRDIEIGPGLRDITPGPEIPQPVAEPGSLAMLATALAAFGWAVVGARQP